MDRKKIESGIDRAAEAAKETVELFSNRIDAVSRCAREKHAQAENRVKETILRATDAVEEHVTASADRIREKIRERK